MDDSVEEWKPVVGHEEHYEVSSWGRLRSFQVKPRPEGRLLVGSPNVQGYCRTVLSRNGKWFAYSVHELVAAAFIGPRPDGMHINHIDFNKENNRVSNLEYVTPQQNRLHTSMAGRASRPNAKLNEQDIREIRELYQLGVSIGDLAEEFGVKWSSVWHIVHRKSWKNVA